MIDFTFAYIFQNHLFQSYDHLEELLTFFFCLFVSRYHCKNIMWLLVSRWQQEQISVPF